MIKSLREWLFLHDGNRMNDSGFRKPSTLVNDQKAGVVNNVSEVLHSI